MILTNFARFCAILVAVTLLPSSLQAEEMVPLIKTRTETYKNVTLVSHNATHVFVQHSRGMATLKLADLEKETLIGLGVLEPEPVAEAATSAKSVSATPSLAAIEKTFKESLNGAPPQLQSFQMNQLPEDFKKVLMIAAAALFFFHLFFSYCAMLICKKTGMEPGILAWIPVFQMIPLIRASGMSGWWFLGCFVPVLNIVVQVLWSIGIAKARGKGVMTTVMLILPVVNILAFLYLAFSGGTGESGDDVKPIRFEPLPA